MPELNIDIQDVDGGIKLVKLQGFLDAHTFEQLDESIGELFDGETFKIIADLGGLEYISSAGAGVFIGALAESQENGGNIVIASATPNVHEVFDLLGLTQIFTMADNADAAKGMF
ncbi:MAG: STAS domain-containing protein [Planctomycetota bacterium]|jgi:anti-sigma B factor antagonist